MNSLQILEAQISRANKEDLHLFLPNLVVLIQNQNHENTNLKILSLINEILNKSQIRNELAYKTLLVVLLKLYHESSAKGCLLEEIVKCFESSNNLHPDVVQRFFENRNNINLLAQCIHVCSEIVRKEKYTKLRVLAINAILSLAQTSTDYNDVVLRSEISNRVFLMLPKIIAVLVEAALEETIKGHILVKTSVFALGQMICLVFEDYDRTYLRSLCKDNFLDLIEKSHNSSVNPNEILGIGIKSKNEREKYLESVTKSKEWLREASFKLIKPLDKLKKLRVAEHYEIRLELAKMSSLLLERCLVNIDCFSSFLVENLLIMVVDDENVELSQYTTNCLNRIISNDNFSHFIKNQILEIFNRNLNSLPRFLYNGFEFEQQIALRLLSGIVFFISSIRKDLNVLLENSLVMEKFLGVLLSCAELDLKNSDLLFETGNELQLTDDFYHLKKPWKNYKNLLNTVSTFQKIWIYIATSDAYNTIVNYLFENTASVEHLVVLNEIISGRPPDSNCELVSKILQDFLDNDSYWNMDVSSDLTEFHSITEHDDFYKDDSLEVRVKNVKLNDVSLDSQKVLNLNHVKYNILCTCMVLETSATASTILGKSFEKYLFKLLHRILVKAGSSNFLIRNAALYSLEQISKALNLENTNELIGKNLEFLLYNIEKMIKKDENKNTLSMLSSILKYADSSASPQLGKIIQGVLIQTNERKFTKNNFCYLNLFKLYIFTMAKWNRSLNESSSTENVPNKQKFGVYEKCIEELTGTEAAFIDYQNVQQEENDSNSEKEIEQKKLPLHIDITKQILTYSAQFFVGENFNETVLVHEIFIIGLPVLKSHDDNVFLPTVHQMWYPFIKLFQNKNLAILQKSLELLLIIAELSTDFIKSKSLSDVVPFVNMFLVELLKTFPDCGNYQMKVLRLILKNYGRLLSLIEVDEKELDQVLDILIKYNTSQVKQGIGGLNLQSLEDLKRYHPALIDLKLSNK